MLREGNSMWHSQLRGRLKTQKEFKYTALLCFLFLCSCANLTTSTKSINLRDHSVALDVKQRVVISSQQEGKFGGQSISIICAEPSPDALTVIGASSGLSINRGPEKAANLSTALSESGAFVGLRTQSIQLLRDAMYRLCEGYASGAIPREEFTAMQRRYQSTMMGLIAIEQLTGPVVASQALLMANAEAKAGSSSADPAVAAAQTRVQAATESALTAQSEVDKANARLDSVTKTVTTAQQKLTVARNKKPQDQAELSTLSDSLSSVQTEEKNAQIDLADKRRRLDAATDTVHAAKAELAQAKANVSSSAGGSGRLGDVAKATTDSNVALADAVTAIVREINRSYSRDGCLTLITQLVNNPYSLTNLAEVDSKIGTDKPDQVSAVAVLRTSLAICATLLAEESKRAAQSTPVDRSPQ